MFLSAKAAATHSRTSSCGAKAATSPLTGPEPRNPGSKVAPSKRESGRNKRPLGVPFRPSPQAGHRPQRDPRLVRWPAALYLRAERAEREPQRRLKRDRHAVEGECLL